MPERAPSSSGASRAARAGARSGDRGAEGEARGRAADHRDPQGVGAGAGSDHGSRARAGAGLGGPDALQQHQDEEPDGGVARRLFRPLHPLRHPRARHGRGHERADAAWRAGAGRRDLHGVHRLLPPGHPHGRADGHPRHLRHDARFHRPRRGWPDPSAGRASRRAAGDPQPQRVPPGRSGRDGRVLAARA